jgi:hypothetical protein
VGVSRAFGITKRPDGLAIGAVDGKAFIAVLLVMIGFAFGFWRLDEIEFLAEFL